MALYASPMFSCAIIYYTKTVYWQVLKPQTNTNAQSISYRCLFSRYTPDEYTTEMPIRYFTNLQVKDFIGLFPRHH